jgi:hypothetical protein
VTLGIGEPFTTTVTVSVIFALILSLPVLVSQLYAFLAPALEPAQRRRMRPIGVAIPVLFIIGVCVRLRRGAACRRQLLYRDLDGSYDERFGRIRVLCLCHCEAGFAERRTCDIQLLAAKPHHRTAAGAAGAALSELALAASQ